MKRLEGRVCVVTGGAGSVGTATARLFLEEGARVALIDLRQADLDRAVERLGGAPVLSLVADVSRDQEVADAVDQVTERLGPIDVLFSNAGNFGSVAPIADYPEVVFDTVYSVHVKGAFLLCKHATPRMRDGGSVIITSSVAGVRGDPGVYGYIVAKHAQIGLMRCLAKELAPRGIRVNTIHPGPIDNSFQHSVEADLANVIKRDGAEFFNAMIPLGRHGTPEEVAQSVLYLASDESRFTTGLRLMVDGGMSA
ncbi:SDR family NAD(P)-dependent oxidoreductase [Bradyrhizobium sp. WSM2254]|uniref:SDR family NAD(P)-dependent oxidoreductase n=1 Tax=Bradyrhizobium sp. WSM2254 TaxID=1188263 RepID=UPI0003FAF7C9|nr:SDR family NAD(P)-dependent oxidoreductase [Bradyrhizobium sp. WSM2254]